MVSPAVVDGCVPLISTHGPRKIKFMFVKWCAGPKVKGHVTFKLVPIGLKLGENKPGHEVNSKNQIGQGHLSKVRRNFN